MRPLYPAAAAPALALVVGLLWAGVAGAKLPPPSDEAKAKAAEAAAKTAHGNLVANYQLCKSIDATAARYHADARKAGREVKPAVATPACVDPGPFVYKPPEPAAGAAPAPTAGAAAPAPSAGAAPAAAKAAAPVASAKAK